jgi:chromosome segregation ATPase
MSIDLLKEKENEISRNINQMTAEQERLVKENGNLQASLDSLEEKRSKLVASISKQSDELEKVKAKHSDAEDALRKLGDLVEIKNSELKRIEKESADKVQAASDALVIERGRLDKMVSGYNNDILSLEKEISGLSAIKEKTEKDAVVGKNNLKQINETIEKSSDQALIARETLDKVLGEIKSNSTTLDSFHSDIAEAKDILATLNKDILGVNAESERLAKEIDSKKGELSAAQKEIDQINRDKFFVSDERERLAAVERDIKLAYQKAGVKYPYDEA